MISCSTVNQMLFQLILQFRSGWFFRQIQTDNWSFFRESDYTSHAVCFDLIGLYSCHVIFVKTFLAIILQYMLLKFTSTSIAYLNKSVTWYICSTIMFHINYSVRLKWKIKIASAYAEESYCSVRHLQQSQSVRQL